MSGDDAGSADNDKETVTSGKSTYKHERIHNLSSNDVKAQVMVMV